MIWFIRTSYGYINPNGFVEHLQFVVDLPGAYIRFRSSMRAANTDGDSK